MRSAVAWRRGKAVAMCLINLLVIHLFHRYCFYYFIISFRMHFLYLWMLDLQFWRFARFSENRTWILSSQFCANDATSSHLYMCFKMESSQNDPNGVAQTTPKKMTDQIYTTTWRLDLVPSVDHQGWTGKSRYGLWATPKCQERRAGGCEGPHLKECSALTKTRRPYDWID